MKILKIGGSVITKKAGYMEANLENLDNAAKAIAKSWIRGIRDIVLIHGAGSFGHPLVLKYGINNGIKNTVADHLAVAQTHNSCSELSQMFADALIDYGAPAIVISPAVTISAKNKKIKRFGSIMSQYLASGYLPILYGDMVPDSVLGASVCSGDRLVSYLGKQAELVALGTDVDGILDKSGSLITHVDKENFQEIMPHIKKVENDVTGGMEGKVREMLELGIPARIFNATVPERIESIIAGKKTICTEIG